MNFKLNFLGITVADFEPAFRFYTKVLGIEARHSKPGWAYFETTGMKFELFGSGTVPEPDQSWGRGQAIRPSLQVADLKKSISDLRRSGVTFVGDVERTSWCESIEFVAPEGTRWTLAHAPGLPFGANIRKPHLGWIEMKAHDPSKQRVFYTDILGMQPSNDDKATITLQQETGAPLLFMEVGGELVKEAQNDAQAPIFLGFETKDINQAAAWIKRHNVPILTDVTKHPSWGGIDLIVSDGDGNPVQIVQYHAIPKS